MLILVFMLFMIVLLGLVIYYARQVVYPKVLTHDYVKNYEFENNTYDPSVFKNLKEEDIRIQTYYGYKLKGKLFLQEKPDKFVLMCHGITSNYDGMKKYCEIYIKNGYSILLYDHRNHGFSDRNYTTFGFYEKKDAKSCVDYLMKRFNEPLIGVHGESMGAATALQLASVDSRLSFCIEDCGYSNLYDLMKFRSSEDHHTLLSYITPLVNQYIRMFYRFSFQDASIIHNINKIKCPVMFIHGEEDLYVPYYMVHDLFHAFEGEKVLYSVEGAKHAASINKNRIKYQEEVQMFLDKYIK